MYEHITVLLEEAINGLNIKPDGIYVDCTLGRGGHSSMILERLTTGHLYAFDQDEEAIVASKARLEKISNNFTLIRSNFMNLKKELEQRNVDRVDGILYDLGVSSPQFDDPSRGFSYNHDARLDMRMDQRQQLSAYEVVNEYEFKDLVRIFSQYGEESFAKSIARRIEYHRNLKPIETTLQLVDIIKEGIPAKARRTGPHPARKVFQALRIEVNKELRAAELSLQQALELLDHQGRICVITFHSLEDRICKRIFKEASEDQKVPKNIPILLEEHKAKFKLITKKAILPSEIEVSQNPRARSSKLRIIERL